MDQLEEMFRNQLSSLWKENLILHGRITDLKQAAKAQAIVESIEIEIHANTPWQELQKVSDQDDFTDGQELLTPINSEPTINI